MTSYDVVIERFMRKIKQDKGIARDKGFFLILINLLEYS